MKITASSPLKKKFKLKWWEIAIISVVASALGGLSSAVSSGDEKKVYNKQLKQAPWAPPAWVFAPAWTINNFFLITALQRILNKDWEGRKKLLWLQGCIWFIFFSYGFIYFNKKARCWPRSGRWAMPFWRLPVFLLH